MDGFSGKRSTSLEKLVIQNITNVSELKAKLNDIINTGKEYEYDVSTCLKSLLNSSDQEIVLLAVQALSELVKCDEKRETYAKKDIIDPLMEILKKEVTSDRSELLKHCCRSIGNLCCDCDASRDIILESGGVSTVAKLLKTTIEDDSDRFNEIKLCVCKALLNFSIGGHKYSDQLVKDGVIELLSKILRSELDKDDMNDGMVSAVILLLSVVNDNDAEIVFDKDINLAVMEVLKETTNMDICELCLDHLHSQAEHDSVKTELAVSGGVAALCARAETLAARTRGGELGAGGGRAGEVLLRGTDLVVLVLTGDEAMRTLYASGTGDVYTHACRWLHSPHVASPRLLAPALLALGNFARADLHCASMMRDGVFEKLLDIFEEYYNLSLKKDSDTHNDVKNTPPSQIDNSPLTPDDYIPPLLNDKGSHTSVNNVNTPDLNTPDLNAPDVNTAPPDIGNPFHSELDAAEIIKIQHAALAAIRNLLVPPANKELACAAGRAGTLLTSALPYAADVRVACGLLAALRMLLDRQEAAGELLARAGRSVGAVGEWAARGGGRAGLEAARLAAWLVRTVPAAAVLPVLMGQGCVAALVNMLLASHSVMQNEAILALTLLAIHSLDKNPSKTEPDFDAETSFVTQIISSEIGKHIAVLIDTNCAKMPLEVAENLIALLDVTSKNNQVVIDYREAKVNESLQKFVDARKDLSDNLKACASAILVVITGTE